MSIEKFDRAKPHLGAQIPPPVISNIALVLTVAGGVVTVCTIKMDGTIDADFKLIAYMTPALGFGITSPKKGMFKLLCSVDPVVSPSTNDFTSAYNTRVSVPEIGDRVWAWLTAISRTSGQRYQLGKVNVIVN